jgi:opacity protein-like surface antigen
MKMKPILVTLVLSLIAAKSFAARGGVSLSGAHSLGIGLAIMSPNQSDVNSWVDSLSLTGTKNLASAYEGMIDYEYRINMTIFSMMFRPSYFTQQASGGGVESKLTGMTIFPMLRLYPLENAFIKFFMQIGLGYGQLKTELSNSNTGGSGSFDGSAFGAMAGLGAQFCFTESHCMNIEGNMRYLPIERNTGSASGSLGGTITQTAGELELNSKDLGTTLSGIQGIIGYKLLF